MTGICKYCGKKKHGSPRKLENELQDKVLKLQIALKKREEEILSLRKHIHAMCEHSDGGCPNCPVYDECDAPGKENS